MTTLALVGGTGKEGRGLALRLAAAGHRVLIGSRSAERAARTAADLRTLLAAKGYGRADVGSGQNLAVIAEADVVFLTLPFTALDELLDQCAAGLGGKIVVDVMAPIRSERGRTVLVPPAAGSASRHLHDRAPAARVVAGFKNVAAQHLLRLGRAAVGDVLLAADDGEAKQVVARLVRNIPALRPVDAGPLANAAFLESLTALELNLNRLHRTVTAIRVLGIA
jgi:NADPH-dependent F420 reductase